MRMKAFWDRVPCNFLQACRRFRVAYCLHQGDGLMTEAVRASETSAYLNETTRRYIPEGYHYHTRRRENLISHSVVTILLIA
jgi:hypothetical protein